MIFWFLESRSLAYISFCLGVIIQYPFITNVKATSFVWCIIGRGKRKRKATKALVELEAAMSNKRKKG